MKKLYILIGIPCSGKSTYCSKNLPNIPIISRDSILEELGESLGANTYNEAWKVVDQKMVDDIFRDRLDALFKGSQDFIIDRTHTTVKSRKHIINQGKRFGFEICGVYLNVPLETIHLRNKIRNDNTGKYIPDHVIADMYDRLKEPTLDEGFDEIIKIIS